MPSVTSIGNRAFADCRSLTNVNMPSVTSLGDGAFSNCWNLTRATFFADAPTTFGTGVFSNTHPSFTIYYAEGNPTWIIIDGMWNGYLAKPILCGNDAGPNLSWALYDEGLLEIIGTGEMWGWGLIYNIPFYDYREYVKTVNIHYGVTNIEGGTFSNCINMTNITIPASVITIGNAVFQNCYSLININIPNSVTSIGSQPFHNSFFMMNITVDPDNQYYSSIDGVLFNKDATTIIEHPKGRGGDYRIPDSVINIGFVAFQGSQHLTSIHIPVGVASIGNVAFEGCYRLTSIIADPDSPFYRDVDGVLFSKDLTTIVAYPGGKVGDYVIPLGTTRIESNAFLGCLYLTKVIIPDGIDNIGFGAFNGCRYLTSATFLGNAPSSFGLYVFQDTAPNFTIYYYECADGWDTPTWNGYMTQMMECDHGCLDDNTFLLWTDPIFSQRIQISSQ